MKIKIIKVIDSSLPEEEGWSREDVHKLYRPTTLYQIEKRDIVQIVYKGKHVRYFMKRTEIELRLGI
jgi:hypothetical protein